MSLDTDKNQLMDNLSYTLSNKRSMLPWKAFIVASSLQNIRHKLPTKLSRPVRSSAAPALSFVFTGQGAQWAGMGRELLEYPVFEASLRKSESCLQSLGSEWALIGESQGRHSKHYCSRSFSFSVLNTVKNEVTKLGRSKDTHSLREIRRILKFYTPTVVKT